MAGEAPREEMSRQILSQENQALKEKNTRLMIENSSLQGKLRGYATLGDLLHEAKRELAFHMKRKHQEDAKETYSSSGCPETQDPTIAAPNESLDPSSALKHNPGSPEVPEDADAPHKDVDPGPGPPMDLTDPEENNDGSVKDIDSRTSHAVDSKMLELAHSGLTPRAVVANIPPVVASSLGQPPETPGGGRVQPPGEGEATPPAGSAEHQDQGKAPGAMATAETDATLSSEFCHLDVSPVEILSLPRSIGELMDNDIEEDSDIYPTEGKASAGGATLPSHDFSIVGSSSGISYPIASPTSPKLPGESDVSSLDTLTSQVSRVAAMLEQADNDPNNQVASQMAQLSLKVIKLNRQMKKKDLVIDQLNLQLQQNKLSLTSDNSKLKKEVIDLRQEKRVLLEKLQEMEKERGNFSLSPASLPSTNYEFVDLDECGRHEPKKAAPELKLDDEILVKASSAPTSSEVALLNKIKRQNDEIKKHKEEIKQLRGTVSTLEHVLELSHMEIAHFSTKKVEDSQREQARMRDIDKMLLAAKKKCEAEEAEKEAIADDLDLERRRGDTLIEANRVMHSQTVKQNLEIEQLKAEVQQLKAIQSSRVLPTPIPVASNLQRNLSAPTGGRQCNQDMMTDIAILKQQIRIYKEDFDRERSDRERAQTEIGNLKEQQELISNNVVEANRKVQQLTHQLDRETEEKVRLKRQLESQAAASAYRANINYQQQPAPKSTMYATAPMPLRPMDQFYKNPVPQQPPTRSVGLSPGLHSPKWSCRMCTFDNPPQRSTCEACGHRRDVDRTLPRSGQGQVPLPMQQMQSRSGLMNMQVYSPDGGIDEVDGFATRPPRRPHYRGSSLSRQTDITTDNGQFN